MKIFIKKRGTATLTEALNCAKNLGYCLTVSYFVATKNGNDCAKDCDVLTDMMYRKTHSREFLWSERAIQFMLRAQDLGLVTVQSVDGHEWYYANITPKTLGLAEFAGVPFGESQISRALGMPPLIGEFRDVSPAEMVETEAYGNEFNGGWTYHATEKFSPIDITDAIGVKYIIVHMPNNVRGGYGTGYKGGFKNKII